MGYNEQNHYEVTREALHLFCGARHDDRAHLIHRQAVDGVFVPTE